MMKMSQSAMEMCFYCEEAGGQTQFVSCKNKVIILTAFCGLGIGMFEYCRYGSRASGLIPKQ